MLEMSSSYLHVLNRICEEVQQDMANKLKDDNEIVWSVKVEVLFLYAMIGHKPVGVNRHFMMIFIHNKFSAYINQQISSKVIWDHLDSMYDMAALNESEIIPFPNDEVDYELPEDCYDLLRSKYGVTLKKSNSDNEIAKVSANSKVQKNKLNASKFKQSSTPISTPKATFVTPVLKPLKNLTVIKTETKTPSTDEKFKTKQEFGLSSKTNKIKRSSSPLLNKTVKQESILPAKEDSPDISSTKKVSKRERSSSPATTKKPIKTEPSSTNNTAKKIIKSETPSNGSKLVKESTPDSAVKKVKPDKDISKKGKMSLENSQPKKSLKIENVNGLKKKSEGENVPKKASEPSSVKQTKTEVKYSGQSSKESETSSGTRKSSPVVKMKSNDSSKKLKRPRVEEPSKKLTPAPKRRRL